MKQRMIGYVRVSRVAGRGEDLISPEIQRRKIEEWAALHDVEVVRWFDEIDQPGSKLERPLFQEALALCEGGNADGIAVYRLDRFARSVVHGLECIKRLEQVNCRFVSVTEGFDAGTDVGRLVLTILFAFAELELKKIAQSWQHAVANAIDSGKYISAKPPVGYQKGEDGRLVVDPDTAPIIRKVFQLRARGKSYRELAEYLDASGIQTAWRSPHWSPSTVGKVLSNRAYLGEARHGETRNAGAHEAIVTEKEWRTAQPGRRIVLTNEVHRSALCVLRGVLICGGCGRRMLVGGGSKKRGKKPPAPHYYCRGRYESQICPSRASAGHVWLDRYVEEQLITAFGNDGPLAEAIARHDRAEAAVQDLDAARYSLAQYVSNTRLIESIGLDAFNVGAEAHQRRVDLAEMTLESARSQKETVWSVIDGDLLQAWKAGELTPLERRAIVTGMVDRVVLYRANQKGKKTSADIPERVQIVLKGNQLIGAASGNFRVDVGAEHGCQKRLSTDVSRAGG
jgi:DNA invertase Pin-like site-specific DNA recombinase